MDKAFWHNIIEDEYAVPSPYSIATLTPELLSYLGSTDSELREELAYMILCEWIGRGNYSYPDIQKMATQLLYNLTIGLDEQQSDTVFLRSFSVLILTEIVCYDLTQSILSEAEVQQLLDQALDYFLLEKDVRGYEPGKGWAHAVAHSSDFLWVLSQHQFVSTTGLMRIMDAIGKKITAPIDDTYLFDEDERLVRAVMSVLQRNLLGFSFLTMWLEMLIHPRGRIAWNADLDGKMMEVVRNKAETCARHNTKHFLRSLFFQLRSPGFANLNLVEHRPPVSDELLPLVEHTLSQIRAWC
ncbi:DUF2785 domain-containing protein [Dictyobacter aurantiacus]|uniref:Membrane protein n=1 Tax=Dictyobacter aurantiacus TaxID=1936993 RepID=A0A401ZQG1_9CHLR|nr:DUF2785 domain-containing protein [Dictyobacter aurantiacus]GCE09105.1 membrane protein [Dictyobacter aurantiacus]